MASVATLAMLLLNQIFDRTWGNRTGRRPPTEYWGDVIPAIKRARPNFRFIAEAHWDLEWELQQTGFDSCYDKRLYDRTFMPVLSPERHLRWLRVFSR